MVCLAGIVGLTLPPAVARAQSRPTVTIGIVLDGITEGSSRQILSSLDRDEALAMLKREVLTLSEREFDVRFPESKLLSGDFESAGIRQAIDRLLNDPEVDAVVTLGALASNEIATRSPLPKPVVAPFIIDAVVQGVPYVRNSSGVRNLNYVTVDIDIRNEVRTFHELVPWDTLHVVYDPLTPELMTNMYAFVDTIVRSQGAVMVPVSVVDEVRPTLARLEGAEAILHTPLARMPDADYQRLIDGYAELRVPSFSLVGLSDVALGVLAGHVVGQTGPQRIMRRVALNLQRIMLGEDAGTLPVQLDGSGRLAINMQTARSIGWAPRWSVATGAELLNEAPADSGARITLAQAIREAIAANLDLRATQRGVAAGEQEVKLARSTLLPQVEAVGGAVQIDEYRASTSLGSTAERTLSGSLGFSQLLFSDPAFGNYTIQKRLQDARQAELEQVHFDIAQEAATAFLDVLRAETLENIQKQNLQLTQSNLDLARRREQVGVSGPADVYRWESRLAADRRDVIATQRGTQAVRAVFNQVLNRPQDLPFRPVVPSLADTSLRTGQGRLLPYVDNAIVFATFTQFCVKEGLDASRELQALDAALEARRRVATIASRRFWLPDLALFGDIGKDFDRSGAGSTPPMLPEPLPQLPTEPQTEWAVGLRASLPLLEGGGRVAEASRANREVERLELEREAVATRVELRIRTALEQVAASSSAIGLNRQSADAARSNLELVTDSYSQGLVSIIELLDAQNNALIAQLQAANSVYDFLVDLFALQRALSNMDFLTTPTERDAWFERLQQYFRDAGVEPIRLTR